MPSLSDQELLNQLNANPALREGIEVLLHTVADEKGELITADEAEFRLIDQMRKMGQTSLKAWAEQQMKKETETQLAHKGTRKHTQKNSVGTAPLGILRSKNANYDKATR